MILLTVEEILNLHNKMIAATGGISGIRDKALLESAVYRAAGCIWQRRSIPNN